MKQWNCLLGIGWKLDTEKYKHGFFRTDNHMLAREKWSALGRGRSKIVRDEESRIWGLKCSFSCNPENIFVIEVEITKW